MELGLRGKRVILTGGSRGIGRATLELFAAEGCDVGFFSRNPEQVATARSALEQHGGKVVGDALDMDDAPAYAPWLERTADALGGCDIFVHGASSSGAQKTGDWDASFRTDLMGAVTGCETLHGRLKVSGAGAVVLMASTAATETFIAPQAFNAIKAALLTYAKQLGQAWGPDGVRVNVVSPGPITFAGGNWEAVKAHMRPFYDATVAQTPLGRLGSAEDVARAVVFLASPASAHTTGTNLVVDGGYTKRVQF